MATIYGTDDEDTLSGGSNPDVIRGGPGDDLIEGGDEADALDGGADDDRIFGGLGDDTIEVLQGDDGDDTIDGGDGFDTLVFAFTGGAGLTIDLRIAVAQDTGAAGVDVIQNISGVTGYGGNDRLTGDGFVNTLRGRGGDDTIEGGGGSDQLSGDDGLDTASYASALSAVTVSLSVIGSQSTGGAGWDVLQGFEALEGSGYDDQLSGSTGSDTLDGGAGVDTLVGGAGDDLYEVDRVADVVTESFNGGLDAVLSAASSWTLPTSVENLTLTGAARNGFGNSGGNSVIGNSLANALGGAGGDDALNGAAGADTLNGGSGTDALTGGAQDDTLLGGDGDDRLLGGLGSDRLYGQSGADLFNLASLAESTVASAGRDVIFDFSSAQDDRIGLSRIDANANVAGDQAFRFVGSGAFSAAGQLRTQTGDGFLLVTGDVDGDRVADFAIRLAGVATLAAGDFIL